MKLGKKIIGIALFGMAISSWADCIAEGCTGKVTRLYVQSSGNVLIGTDQDERTVGCTAESEKYLTLDTSKPYANNVYASLLSSYTSGETVFIRTTVGSGNCDIVYVIQDKSF